MEQVLKKISLLSTIMLLASCSYNPFSGNNHTTGDPKGVAVGAAVGAGGVGLLGGSKYLIAAAGVAGGVMGYYFTTLRYDSGGVVQSGGQVYQVGQIIGIYIPSDKLFEPNTSEFLPQARTILDSAADVLQRYPNHNILVSGNTSGFGMRKWEQKLSEERAGKVAAYLWDQGINHFKNPGIDTSRKLNYVGYGDYFPIANPSTNKSIRQNSRIQITSYPSKVDLHIDNRHLTLHNIGSLNDEVGKAEEKQNPCDSFKDSCR